MSEWRVLDLFCGAGGFSEGFRQQGFKIVAGIDFWKPAVETFNYNFGVSCEPRNLLDFEEAVHEIELLPDTEIILGSPPCVSFSTSNKSGKADKTMGLRLSRVMLRIVAIKKHKADSSLKAWFMENVRNSTMHLPSTYSFEELGLATWARANGLSPGATAINLEENRCVVNSADYGTPQLRVRAFTGEILGGRAKLPPPKSHAEHKPGGGLPRYVTLEHIRRRLPGPHVVPGKGFIADPLYPGIRIRSRELTDQYYDTGLYASEWKMSRYLKLNHPYMGAMSFPEREDRPSRTIMATKIGTSREAMIFESERRTGADGKYRTPTIREAATLMGFPITYQFFGSEGIKWALVGNAVCPPVSSAFAAAVRRHCRLSRILTPRLDRSVRDLQRVPNLNTFRAKSYSSPPKKNRGSRFRRHPFKDGNLTVTLSNYDIRENGRTEGMWHTSIQYGTGDGYPVQAIPDGYYRTIEPIIRQFEGGEIFLGMMKNGFAGRIGRGRQLQAMYEAQKGERRFLEPTQLVERVAEIIEGISLHEPRHVLIPGGQFLKPRIPKKQIMALYALNRICTIANGGAR